MSQNGAKKMGLWPRIKVQNQPSLKKYLLPSVTCEINYELKKDILNIKKTKTWKCELSREKKRIVQQFLVH